MLHAVTDRNRDSMFDGPTVSCYLGELGQVFDGYLENHKEPKTTSQSASQVSELRWNDVFHVRDMASTL